MWNILKIIDWWATQERINTQLVNWICKENCHLPCICLILEGLSEIGGNTFQYHQNCLKRMFFYLKFLLFSSWMMTNQATVWKVIDVNLILISICLDWFHAQWVQMPASLKRILGRIYFLPMNIILAWYILLEII